MNEADRLRSALRTMKGITEEAGVTHPVIFLHDPDDEDKHAMFGVLLTLGGFDLAEAGMTERGWNPMAHTHVEGDEYDPTDEDYVRDQIRNRVNAENVLEAAERMTSKTRAVEYGEVLEAAECFAKIASGMTGLEILPQHFPLLMQALKFSRIAQAPFNFHLDSWTDVAGWARVAEMLATQRLAREDVEQSRLDDLKERVWANQLDDGPEPDLEEEVPDLRDGSRPRPGVTIRHVNG